MPFEQNNRNEIGSLSNSHGSEPKILELTAHYQVFLFLDNYKRANSIVKYIRHISKRNRTQFEIHQIPFSRIVTRQSRPSLPGMILQIKKVMSAANEAAESSSLYHARLVATR